MKVEHIVQIQVVMYYNTVVEDDTDHPMTDDQITEIVKDRMLEQGPGSRNFEAVDVDVEEEDIDRVIVLQTINADPESPGYLEDITDDFIDLQRKLKTMDRSVENLKKEIVSPPVDLSDFISE